MVDLTTRIKDLPLNASPNPNQFVPTDLSSTQRLTIQGLVDTGAPVASQAEAEAGENSTKRMTPLTTRQAIAAQSATVDQVAQIVAIGSAISPTTDYAFSVSLGQTFVTVSGGYQVGKVAEVFLSGVRISGWAAVDGATITFPAITNSDLAGDASVDLVAKIGMPTTGFTALDARYSRALSTDISGYVFAPSEIAMRQLGINTTDKKLYSKNSSNSVFQVAKSGREAGDYLQFENYDGSGLQGIGIKDGGRVWFKRDNDAVTDFTNVWLTRDIKPSTPGLGTAGATSSALRIEETITKPIDSFEWAFVVNLRYEPAVGSAPRAGEHCAIYPRVEKRGDGRVWAVCSEFRDFSSNPTTGSVNMEIGCGATGPDPNNQRIGIHMVIGSANDTAGENIVSDGIAIFAHPGYGQSKRHIRLQGQGKVGIDMREMDTVYSNTGLALATNQYIKWADTINQDINTPAGTKGSIGFSSSNNTIAFSGVRGQFGAPTPDRTVLMEFGGVLLAIPAALA